jgi:serine/threonine-protein kinase
VTPADPFDLVGAVVDGRYRVLRAVGQGGFGVVYRAQHLGFDSPIALKLLKLPDDCSNPRRQARIVSFQREGRMLFELSYLHASVLRAHETGTIRARDGSLVPYLALEWLDGVSLAAELEARRASTGSAWSLHSALDLLRGPAEALAIAHARGIAHRDVKPANLFIATRDGEQCVKILDFGIAKLVDASAETLERTAHPLASTASFTPLYAAPEQWVERLGATGGWTDVHALALVLVELLCGRPPFLGREPAQLMAACLDPLRPTPAALGADVSADVEAVFARALALEPRDRFPEVGAFLAALKAAAHWDSGEAGPAIELLAAASRDGAESQSEWNHGQPAFQADTTATTARSVSLPRRTPPAASRFSRAGTIAVGVAAIVVAVLGAHATRVFVATRPRTAPAVESARALVASPSRPPAAAPRGDTARAAPMAHLNPSVSSAQNSRSPLPSLHAATGTPVPPAPSGDTAAFPPRPATASASAASTAAPDPTPKLTGAPSRSFPHFD